MEKNENERKQDGKGREQDKIKIIVSFPSDLTRDVKFKKKIAKKIRKFKKYHYGFISSQIRYEEAEKGRK